MLKVNNAISVSKLLRRTGQIGIARQALRLEAEPKHRNPRVPNKQQPVKYCTFSRGRYRRPIHPNHVATQGACSKLHTPCHTQSQSNRVARSMLYVFRVPERLLTHAKTGSPESNPNFIQGPAVELCKRRPFDYLQCKTMFLPPS